MSSRSLTIVGQPGDGGLHRVEQLLPLGLVEALVVHAQRLGRRAQPGQRRAQVVGDGGEQGGTGAVAGLELLGGHALAGQLLALAQHADVGGERRRDRPLARAELGAAQHQPAAGTGRQDDRAGRGRSAPR